MKGSAERDWLIPAVLVAGSTCVVIWGAAVLASLISFHLMLPAPSGIPNALAWWLVHPGRPQQGFPATERADLPGAAGLYIALALELAGLYRLSRRMLNGHRRISLPRLWSASLGGADGARWAARRELCELVIKSPCQPGRLVLGRMGRTLIATEARHSLLVVGPTQTHKTTGLAIPALMEWQGPALVTSVKRDLLDVTVRARSEKPIWVYDPRPAGGLESCCWNPLEQCRSWQGALRMTGWLVGAAQASPGKSEEARFWQRAAEKLLAPILFAAACNGLPMSEVVHWLDSREIDKVEECLRQSSCQLAKDAWQASKTRDERTLSSIYTTAEAVLCAYQDPAVLKSTLGKGLTGARLLDKSGTAYICAPAHEQERLAPLFGALVREVIAAAYDRYAETGRPLDPPLLVLLDEAGNIAPIPDLAKLAATAAGIGVQIVSVWHDLSQLESVYGRQAATVTNNHRAKLVLSGIGDEKTLRWVESTLGKEPTVHRQRITGERNGESETTEWRPLAPATLTRQQRPGEGILIYGAYPPARLRLRPYFADPELRRRAFGTEPQHPRKSAWRRLFAVRSTA